MRMAQPGGNDASRIMFGVHSVSISVGEDQLMGLLKTGQRGSDNVGDSHVEGEISNGELGIGGGAKKTETSSEAEFDESIMTTITRDLSAVGRKLIGALIPNCGKNVLMKEWDLWGPLILCTYIGLMLQGMGTGQQLAQLFILVGLGTVGVTYELINMSHATLSIFQSVCVLGYSLGPLALSVTLFELMQLFRMKNGTTFMQLLVVVGCVAWSSYLSSKALWNTAPKEKRFTMLAPIIVHFSLVGLLIFFTSVSQ